jgi:glycosyltransferase involved in cell wall biosynthesis
MVLIEAMACGIPAVTFTCPSGPSEIIEDGVDGLHVKNGDVNDLSQNICMLIEDKKCRISMGKLAKTNAKRFKIDVISNQWITLFDKITKKKD